MSTPTTHPNNWLLQPILSRCNMSLFFWRYYSDIYLTKHNSLDRNTLSKSNADIESTVGIIIVF